jgi:hypothetical protein
MKIAIVGGNLLGCATALGLALVAEHDDAKHTEKSKTRLQSAVLFEQSAKLGGSAFRAVHIDGAAPVEIGSARLLNAAKGTFLQDLIDVANGHRNAFRLPFLDRAIRIPGTPGISRGQSGAVPLVHPWCDDPAVSVRSFGAWDRNIDEYTVRHGGFPVLDFLTHLVRGDALRIPFLAAAIYAFMCAMQIPSKITRGLTLLSPLTLLTIAGMGPANAVRRVNKALAFWASTIALLFKHGMTVGVSRGATVGFVKHLEAIRDGNLATCALSVGQLLRRTQLDRYVFASAEDFFARFKYDPLYAERYLTPVVDAAYPGIGTKNVNALAAHFALLQGDYANSDATDLYATAVPSNSSLCPALIKAATANLPVETRLETRVTAIAFDNNLQKYRVTSTSSAASRSTSSLQTSTKEEIYDGVVLCAHATQDLTICLANGVDSRELLKGASSGFGDVPVIKSPGSYLAIVRGRVNPVFFGYARDVNVPDIVQATCCLGFARFERIRTDGKISILTGKRAGLGLYAVDCSDKFQSHGLLMEMFEAGSELLHFAPRPPLREIVSPLKVCTDIDDAVPFLLLGKRFVYAAATDLMSRHPEMDAISANNAASLFSNSIDWTDGEDNAIVDEGSGDFDE